MTRALPTSCSPPLSRKTLATEPGFNAVVQPQRKEFKLTFSVCVRSSKGSPFESIPDNFRAAGKRTRTSLRRSGRLALKTSASRERKASKSIGFSKYAVAPSSLHSDFVVEPASPLTMKTGVNWVEVSAVNVRHSSKPENFGIRRSNKMAEGLFCIANAKPCSGSPVSTISYKSERLSRNKRRIASSSSITSNFCISSTLLCSRAMVSGLGQRQQKQGQRWRTLVL